MTINPLTHYFLKQHPKDAARSLEKHDPEVLAGFLNAFPVKDVANVFRQMNTSITAACLSHLELEKTAAILEQFSIERAAMLLRRMSFTDRLRIIRKLSPITGNMIKLVMRYPAGTVGQVMNPNVFAIHKNRSVAEVIDSVKASYDQVRSKVYLIDDSQHLSGMVFIRDLLVGNPEMPVEKIMREPEMTISARANLESIQNHPQWRDRDNLPVVDQTGKFIGILKRGVMMDTLARESQLDKQGDDIVGTALDMAELFWMACANIITPQDESSFRGQKK